MKMGRETRSTDAKGRVSLPRAFANATVIIEQVNENELRIRKARVIPEDEIRFSEEAPIVLSNQERERFLQALDQPPKPNAALRRLMAGKAKTRG
jgi:DNA-binding transcriptional regulator/RsmH inhibitor MraZ